MEQGAGDGLNDRCQRPAIQRREDPRRFCREAESWAPPGAQLGGIECSGFFDQDVLAGLDGGEGERGEGAVEG